MTGGEQRRAVRQDALVRGMRPSPIAAAAFPRLERGDFDDLTLAAQAGLSLA